MHTNHFLLYGANGYTGQLIINYAQASGLLPILAGRREEMIRPLAEASKFPYRIIDINDPKGLLQAVREVKLVVNVAGPFDRTARQLIEACLQGGTHYVDINGDINVFEMIRGFDARAREKNIMLLPGAGFDVVPTDCMALLLKNKLPAATHLKLAFATRGGMVSHGTAMTMVNRLGKKGAVREDGRIVEKPLGQHGMRLLFWDKKLFFMSIPWGDVSTAYFTTGIPNIETFTAVKPAIYRLLKFQPLFNWLLRMEGIRNIIRKKIKKRPAGPDEAMRSKAKSMVWGEAKAPNGATVTAKFTCADGYTLTAQSCLLIAGKILKGDFKPGYQTPASCYGEGLVREMPGFEMERGDSSFEL